MVFFLLRRFLCIFTFIMLAVMKDVFKFKQFDVEQCRSAMKVGTDGVLLGAWCDADNAGRVLDIGCGTGLISLMIAQRSPEAIIDAVEIDRESAEEANGNFLRSKWADRLHSVCQDILSFNPGYDYGLIVSNPPFFKTGETAPDNRRAAARHCITLSFSDLFAKAWSLLAPDGLFAMIAPAEVKTDVEFCAGECDFWIKRRAAVVSKSGKPVMRYLWEFTKVPVELEETVIVIHSSEGYSQEYVALIRDFYLNI